jgi:hypothetical protein
VDGSLTIATHSYFCRNIVFFQSPFDEENVCIVVLDDEQMVEGVGHGVTSGPSTHTLALGSAQLVPLERFYQYRIWTTTKPYCAQLAAGCVSRSSRKLSAGARPPRFFSFDDCTETDLSV